MTENTATHFGIMASPTHDEEQLPGDADKFDSQYATWLSLKLLDGEAEVYRQNGQRVGQYPVNQDGVDTLEELHDQSYPEGGHLANDGEGLLAEEGEVFLGEVLGQVLDEGYDEVTQPMNGVEDVAEVRGVKRNEVDEDWEYTSNYLFR